MISYEDEKEPTRERPVSEGCENLPDYQAETKTKKEQNSQKTALVIAIERLTKIMHSLAMATKVHMAALIDKLLEAPKTLAGVPAWQQSERVEEKTLIWPLRIDDLPCGADLKATAYPTYGNGKEKWRIMIIAGKCICRLDHTYDKVHVNSLNKPADLPDFSFNQPHFHSWPDNKRFCTHASLPDRLRNARILLPNIRTFPNALRWFCSETNIALPTGSTIDLPPRDRLL